MGGHTGRYLRRDMELPAGKGRDLGWGGDFGTNKSFGQNQFNAILYWKCFKVHWEALKIRKDINLLCFKSIVPIDILKISQLALSILQTFKLSSSEDSLTLSRLIVPGELGTNSLLKSETQPISYYYPQHPKAAEYCSQPLQKGRAELSLWFSV